MSTNAPRAFKSAILPVPGPAKLSVVLCRWVDLSPILVFLQIVSNEVSIWLDDDWVTVKAHLISKDGASDFKGPKY